ncbi:MAG: winged helix-turn-helix domain-containing protein [Lysobacterales bacterium]
MSIYQFDSFTYDPGSYRLSNRAGIVALEPKVAELLALLIEERQRVVSRAEIFESLWPNQVIGDAALSRLLYELRKALGDEAVNPRFIRTVPRRGIQFIADVESPAVESGQKSVGTVPSQASQPSSPGSPLARLPWVPWVGGVLAVVAFWGVWQAIGNKMPAQSLQDFQAREARIAVLTGVAAGAGSEAGMVMVTVSDLLGSRLAALPGVEVRSPQYVEATSAQASSIEAFADQSQVNYVVSLNVAPASSENWVRLQGELIQMRADRDPLRTPLGRIELPKPAADTDLKPFLAARDQIIQKVADEIGVLVSGQLSGSEPQSLEAWRLYLQAKDQLGTLTCDTTGTAGLIQRALELDPEFGSGWILLGFAHYNQIWACGAGRETGLKVLAAVRSARELDPLIPGSVLLEVSILTELGQIAEAETLARASLAQRPANAVLMATLSYVLTYAGQLDEAAQLIEAAVSLDPLVLGVEMGMTPNVFLHQQQWRTYLTYGPPGDAPIERYYRAFAHWQMGNQTQALQLTDGCRSIGRADVFAEYCQILGLLLRGDTNQAAILLKALVIERRGGNLMDGEMDYKIAQLLSAADENALALDSATLAWQRGFQCRSCYSSAPLFARLRESPASAKTFAEIYQSEPPR